MKSYYITGLILSHENIGEGDRLIVFLTKERGKLKAVARGSRKISSKLAGSLEPLNAVKAWINIGKTFDIIKGVEVLRTFPNVRKDLNRYLTAIKMLEFTEVIAQENDNGEKFYKLLLGVITALDRYDVNIDSLLRFFWINVLSLTGYKLRLDRCICGETDISHFSPSSGGAVCRDCALRSDDAMVVSGKAIELLREYEGIRLSEAIEKDVPQILGKEVDDILERFRVYHTGIKLKSEEVKL
jgi:DNA repair protein RecO (recombination protein O)